MLTNEGNLNAGFYDLYIFIQKNKKEPFYSFGKIKKTVGKEIAVITNGKKINKVEFTLDLEQEIPIELFEYINM